jgi:hypothetical protein
MPGPRRNLFLVPLAALCLLLVFTLAACKKKEFAAGDTSATSTTDTSSTTTVGSSGGGSFKPVPLPNPGIPGFAFPEPEPKIIAWTEANDQKAINDHAWGIWTALTLETDEVFNNQKLRVFETWQDPADVIASGASGVAAAAPATRLPRRLTRPHQFAHAEATVTPGESTVLGFVKYDPTAAAHITKNKLFSKTALSQMLANGQASVPDFPVTGVSLKPVFQKMAEKKLVGGRYYQLTTWPGSPALKFNQAKNTWDSRPFPESAWGQCVWIDIKATGDGPGTGAVDTSCLSDGSSRTDASTYGLGKFIHFQLTAAEAALMNVESAAQGSSSVSKAGDYSVLVAMHVTSREITRWTWQTFWWLPNADNPTAPSSPEIAAERPAQLKGAPRNYAHCAGYSMENPPQPNTGGQNVGDSIYCFNPYLEAPFDPGDLPDSIPGMTMFKGQAVKTPNNVGSQTNCMSCHERANYNPNKVKTAPRYSGDRYVDLNDPAFKGTLKVDFLWSIPGNAK